MKPSAWMTKKSRKRLGHPDEHGQDGEPGDLALGIEGEDALLEALVVLERPACGSGSRARIRRPKLRTVKSPMASTMTTTTPSPRMKVTAGRQAGAEAPEAGRQAEDGDREEVEDALDEDRAEGPAERRVVVEREQVGAVDVAQLGRHEAVDQPADEDDLGRVADPDRSSPCPRRSSSQR